MFSRWGNFRNRIGFVTVFVPQILNHCCGGIEAEIEYLYLKIHGFLYKEYTDVMFVKI